VKTILFFAMCGIVLTHIILRLRRLPSGSYGQVDVIVPGYNEEVSRAR
jgi:hypothetical protein